MRSSHSTLALLIAKQLAQSTKAPDATAFEQLGYAERAEVFVDACLLAAACQPLADQHWLLGQAPHARDKDEAFETLIDEVLRDELAPLGHLGSFFAESTPRKLKDLAKAARLIIEALSTAVRDSADENEFRGFARATMQGMALLNRRLTSQERNRLGNLTYRAFDELDRILGLDYGLDRGMASSASHSERLYEGAGVGVQTAYSTLLIALDELAPSRGSRFIDLGSGYGRVGLVVGLLREDIQFTGYEFVGHRVEASRISARKAGLASHVSFVQQDLSDRSFRIPLAETYYMYDPFSEDTYRHVFRQLDQIGREHPVAVVTKGNANAWVDAAIDPDIWTRESTHDEGAIGIFRSRGSLRPTA